MTIKAVTETCQVVNAEAHITNVFTFSAMFLGLVFVFQFLSGPVSHCVTTGPLASWHTGPRVKKGEIQPRPAPCVPCD